MTSTYSGVTGETRDDNTSICIYSQLKIPLFGPGDAELTGTILRTIVDNLGRDGGILAVLHGAVSNSIEEVGLAAEAHRIGTTAKVIGHIEHVGNANLL